MSETASLLLDDPVPAARELLWQTWADIHRENREFQDRANEMRQRLHPDDFEEWVRAESYLLSARLAPLRQQAESIGNALTRIEMFKPMAPFIVQSPATTPPSSP